MLINLDPTSFEMPNDEVYSVGNNSKGKLLMNGIELEHCIYCNVTRGFAVCVKTDLKGKLIVVDGDIIHDLRFGVMTFQPAGKDFDAMAERIKMKRELNGKATNHEIEL